jgi:hypothetical protein
MRPGHRPVWHEDRWPPARENFLARVLAPVNRLFRGRLGRVARWVAAGLSVVVAGFVGLYLAFLTGLLSADVATPWIISALEEKLPPGHTVRIGRTRLDYDSAGAPVLTAEDLVIRNPMNEEVVRAPTAEVGFEAGSLLMGTYRARRISLIGAVVTIRLDEQGNIKVAPPKQKAQQPVQPQIVQRSTAQAAPAAAPSEPLVFPDLAAWLDNLERTGLDGIALAEVALERGTLIVESGTPGRYWQFNNINSSVRRPGDGGVTFRLSSGDGARPWELNASIGAVVNGVRAIDLVADRVIPNDLLYAAGYGNSDIFANTPVSALLRAQIAVDGRLVSGSLRAIINKGQIGNAEDDRGRFEIDEAHLGVRFDPQRRAFIVEPFRITGGQNQIALAALIEAPKEGSTIWSVLVPQGAAGLSTGRTNEPRLSIDRMLFRGGYDPRAQRLTIEDGVLRGPTAGIALSGSIDFGGDTPMLQLGLAGDRMPVSALKRLWPAPVSPGTRTWVLENVESGVVDRVVIGLNLPLDVLGQPNVPLPDGAIKLEIEASAAKFTPVAGLPPISEAKASVLVTGRTAKIRLTNGVVELGRKRRLLVPAGTLEVPDHSPKHPDGIIQMRIEGTGEAFADFLSRDILKGETGITLDPETTKGNVVANLRIELPFKRDLARADIRFAAETDVTNFTAENVVRGQRVENATAKVLINSSQIQIKGEAKLAGAPAVFEYKKAKGKPDSEFRVNATLDETARSKFGIELSPWLTGPVAVRAAGFVNDKETRINVEADLTGAQITELVPGWNKAAGKQARALYRIVERDGVIRLEDVNVTGSGVNLRGTLELDKDNNLNEANFTNFQLSDGDRSTLRAERANDGALRVTVRGTVLDARGLLRSLSEGQGAQGKKKEKPRDLDLDIRLGAATGNNGEVIRNLELRVVRRNGEIRSFALIGKIGRDSSIVGELRTRDGGTPVVYVTAGDAGALFRFGDYYSKIQGGEIWVVLDTPRTDNTPQEGIVSVRNFSIVGEPNLDRLVASAPAQDANPSARNQPRGGSAQFVRMRIDFTRTPGRFTIKEALIFGPTIGATVDGVLDYAQNNVHIRGTYVPAYALNNLFGQIPLVGLFLGGPKEGLLAITFEIVGPASRPILRVNPMSMAAPGFFRKIFEFRGAQDAPPAAPVTGAN